MFLHTPRLRLVPLVPEQLALYLQDPAKLEAVMGWKKSGQILNKQIRQALEWRYWMGMEQKDAFHWYTNWQIIVAAHALPVGFACFQGPPSAPDFTVELGYWIYWPYRRHGYMTEAAKTLCDWALAQPHVRTICAQTEYGNYPSEGVLKNCGMQLCKLQDGIGLWCKSYVFCTNCAKKCDK